jgi:hypothetical protein
MNIQYPVKGEQHTTYLDIEIIRDLPGHGIGLIGKIEHGSILPKVAITLESSPQRFALMKLSRGDILRKLPCQQSLTLVSLLK